MTLRVNLPGALYRIALHTCGSNRMLNDVIVHLLGRTGLVEQVVDELAAASADHDGGRFDA
jgi:hypothetical protein